MVRVLFNAPVWKGIIASVSLISFTVMLVHTNPAYWWILFFTSVTTVLQASVVGFVYVSADFLPKLVAVAAFLSMFVIPTVVS